MHNKSPQSAFSLVELSIVLVILGLLAGGILAGQSLIRASELRSVMTDATKFKTAISSFRDKYFENPGDITTATKFWGAADGGDGLNSDCRDAETSDIRTCNGNGDGLISYHPNWEYSRLWQHLSNAGLIEGSYIGTGVPAVTVCTGESPGCVYPGSKIGGGAMWKLYTVAVSANVYSFYTNKNALMLTNTFNPFLGFTLKPEETYNIDMKMDDGRPGVGYITASRTGACDTSPINSTSDAARMTAEYRLSSTSVACVPFFMNILQ